MREIQPRFAEKLDFLAQDIGSGSSIDDLHSFAQEQEYPWPVAQADANMLRAFNVTVQSTKIAIDGNGVIVYRAGYGEGTTEEWASIFEHISDQGQSK